MVELLGRVEVEGVPVRAPLRLMERERVRVGEEVEVPPPPPSLPLPTRLAVMDREMVGLPVGPFTQGVGVALLGRPPGPPPVPRAGEVEVEAEIESVPEGERVRDTEGVVVVEREGEGVPE